MARFPLPSVPSRLIDVEVAGERRRGAELAVLVPAGADEPEHSGKAGEVRRAGDGWLVGIGAGEPADWRAAGAALAREAADTAKAVQIELDDGVTGEQVAELALGALLGGYRFKVGADTAKSGLRTIRLVTRVAPSHERVVERVRVLAAASALARDLANTPSNVKNPAWLADTAARVAGEVPGLSVTIRDEQWLAAQGFGGVLAVGGGSASPPRLIELTYRPRGAVRHLLLVGKGITFDTGGLSIKPADGMHLMRTDMAGGGAVIAAARAIASLRLPVRVTALVPSAENHVSGSSYRPGDVVRHYGGRTAEVANTDAEGRMVMADALAYGIRRFTPDAAIDVATLTGAMKVALGLRTGGLFATDDKLADGIREAGASVGEAWWRMPLLEAHADAVRGELADVKQAPGGPGGITAALFLKEFTEGLPWAHLDIAGPARAEQPYAEVVPGATGFAARTLVAFAEAFGSDQA
ncbi:M17 family metallopeptidase [Amycolatopsis endophytica]|uniref:Probable cytosol aminopeptidase n=1 Tax=Amycolatopsis endophytica TaxID=860233 RepID=A0A853AXY6_9PSEU|nr:leucyl aminopeptidase family protein [Amycolatopsis endophytica]NYI87499.1 leucyl aminopeptidase [Amycolatopsis endophytica]